jgi:hypothetical protein
MAEETYGPGEKVLKSGIYRVVHDENHAEPHEVTCVASEPFPPCRNCGGAARFTLVRAAHHVTDHEQFERGAIRRAVAPRSPR